MTERKETPELAQLRSLRDAVRFVAHPTQSRDPSYGLQEFAYAAHAALGPDGCITKELKVYQETVDAFGKLVVSMTFAAAVLQHERDDLASQLEEIHSDRQDLIDDVEAQMKGRQP